MKILICICTYKRNNILNECLTNFKKIIIPSNFNIKFLIVDNTINGNAKNIINQIKKSFNYKIYYVNEKKRGIVHARNKCLEEVRKINCDYFPREHLYINLEDIIYCVYLILNLLLKMENDEDSLNIKLKHPFVELCHL